MQFDFIKDVGEKIVDAVKAEDAEEMAAGLERRLKASDFDIGHLELAFDDGTVTLSGVVADEITAEKAILIVGNTSGVAAVVDEFEVAETIAERVEAARARHEKSKEKEQAEADEAPADESEKRRQARREERKERRRRERLRERRRKRASVFYTVVSGDTLSKIAREHYGDAAAWPAVFEANTPMLKNPDLIYPGQVLRIPSQKK